MENPTPPKLFTELLLTSSTIFAGMVGMRFHSSVPPILPLLVSNKRLMHEWRRLLQRELRVTGVLNYLSHYPLFYLALADLLLFHFYLCMIMFYSANFHFDQHGAFK